MTLREGGTLPPSLGRRCPEGAEARSLSGMKRNVRQSFHVSASHVAESAMFPVIRHPRLFCLTANEKDFSLSLEMTLREGGTLPPFLGRRCPEGAEARSLSGMKRNVRQSFRVSASHVAESAMFPVIPLLTAVLDRERKRFLAFARNDDGRKAAHSLRPVEGGLADILDFDFTLPPSSGRRCPEGAEVGSRRGMKGMRDSPLPYRHPEHSRGIFFVFFFRCRHV